MQYIICLIDVKEIKISGHISVMEGETLNLTCTVESFPPSLITWTKLSEKNFQNGTEINLQNKTLSDLRNTETYLQADRGMSRFSIYNMTVEDSGEYICTAKHLNNTLMKKVDITVKCKYTVCNCSLIEHFSNSLILFVLLCTYLE